MPVRYTTQFDKKDTDTDKKQVPQIAQNSLLKNSKSVIDYLTADTNKRDNKFPFQSTDDAFTLEDRQMAMLIRMSSDVQKAQLSSPAADMEGLVNEAQVFQKLDLMKRIGLGDFTLLPEFSNNQELVFKNKETNRIWVAARGTEGKYAMTRGNLTGYREPHAWLQIASGTEGQAEPHLSIRETVNKLIDSGIKPDDILLGGSSMGARVFRVADDYGIEAKFFGPASGPNDVYGIVKHPEIQHTLVSTTTDLPSLYMRASEGRPQNINVRTVDPQNTFRGGRIKPTSFIGNPYDVIMDHHIIQQVSSKDELEMAKLLAKDKLETDFAEREPAGNSMELMMKQMTNSYKQGELMARQDIRDTIKAGGTYTDYMKRGTNTGDYIEDSEGNLRLTGTRVVKGSNFYKWWQQEVDNLGGIPQGSDSKFADKYFTQEELDFFNKSPVVNSTTTNEQELTDEELNAFRNGELTSDVLAKENLRIQDQMNRPDFTPMTPEERDTLLKKIDSDYDTGQLTIPPIKLNILKKVVGGAGIATRVAGAAGLNYMYKNTGLKKEQADYLTGATMTGIESLPKIAGKTIAADSNIAAKTGTLIKGITEVASVDAPAAGAGFVAADETYDATDKILGNLNVKPEHRILLDTTASAGVAGATQEALSNVTKMGVNKVGTKLLGRTLVSATEKVGTKVLTSSMKASVVGAVLGETIDVGVNTYSLFDALSKKKQVTTDQIGDSVNNILNPYAFVDDIGNMDTGSQTGNTALKIASEAVDLIPGVSQFKMLGEGGSFLAESISHAAGAKSNAELQYDYQNITNKYLNDLGDQTMDANQYIDSPDLLRDKLSADDLSVINTVNPDFFKEASRQYKIIWHAYSSKVEKQKQAQNLISEISQKRESDVFYSPESLKPEDQKLLNEEVPDYMKSWESQRNSYISDARLHKLSPDDYQRVQNGESYESVIKEATTRAGYLRTEDYLEAFNDPAKAHADRLRTRKVADSYDETEKKTHESFYSVDEAEYPNAVDNWTPDQSFILQAHNRNFTLNQFNTFMQQLASRSEYAESNAYNTAKVYHDGTMYTKMDLDRENEEDLKHFTEDLVYHGYRADAYTHRVNSSGIIEFQKNDTTRSMSQAQSIQYITKTFPRARIDFTNPSSISDMYQRAVAANTDTTDNSNVSLSDFWRMYSTQGSSQGMSRENLSFTITPKIREELENAKALGFTGRNDKEIYENYIAKKSKLDSVSPNVNENVKVNDSVQADEGVYKTKNTYGNDIIRTDAPMLSS